MLRSTIKYGAVAGTFALATLTCSPALAADGSTGEGDASASTGTGALFNLLDTGACTAKDTASTASGKPTGRCGDGLNLNDQISAFTQLATAPGDGTSTAEAHVAPIDIANFKSIDLPGVLDGIENIDTGTVLDDILQPLVGPGGVLTPGIQALRDAAIAPINSALQQALAPLHDAIPLTAEIGAVNSKCVADGTPSADGNATLAGVDIVLPLGPTQVRVPLLAATTPNSPLVASVPRQAVNDVVDGLKATFTQSLGGALGPLNDLLSTVQSQLTDKIFDALEPTLLSALDDALQPLVAGTANKQVRASNGEIEVTALDLTLLGSQNLKLARTHCGPNSRVGAPSPSPTPTDNGNPTPTTPAGNNLPTKVESGLAGDQGMNPFVGAAAALLTMAGAGSMAYRRLRVTRG